MMLRRIAYDLMTLFRAVTLRSEAKRAIPRGAAGPRSTELTKGDRKCAENRASRGSDTHEAPEIPRDGCDIPSDADPKS